MVKDSPGRGSRSFIHGSFVCVRRTVFGTTAAASERELYGCRGFPILPPTAVHDRDLLSLSAKTRILQLRSQQIDYPLGWGATKAMGDLSGVISTALKLY
jgi:hypothetical protein